jgi:hypothetical protein
MDPDHGGSRSDFDAERGDLKESTLLQMLFGGLALIVIGAGVIMSIV